MSVLQDIRVVELANERVAYAGKLMADMGAEVILIEPLTGDPSRRYPPFVDNNPAKESLYFAHYNTNKHSVALDLNSPSGHQQFAQLIQTADILLEGANSQTVAQLNLEFSELSRNHAQLIHIALTPYGRHNPLSDLPATDLTLMAAGGPPWSCGYDDHNLPPMRGWGEQAYHTGAHYAFMSALTALLYQGGDPEHRPGQFIDVSIVAALNVTTEAATYTHLLNGGEVQRQTGRHASVQPTGETQMQCADGNFVNTGVPPRFPVEFARLLDWLNELNLIEQFPESVFLEMGAKWEGPFNLSLIGQDDTITAIFSAGRQGLQLIASNVTAYDFFIGCQNAGLSVGVINTPEAAFEDPHFIERGFQATLIHGDREVRYPGAPYPLPASPWSLRATAPELGAHTDHYLTGLE